jgi:hypothetical protein
MPEGMVVRKLDDDLIERIHAAVREDDEILTRSAFVIALLAQFNDVVVKSTGPNRQDAMNLGLRPESIRNDVVPLCAKQLG